MIYFIARNNKLYIRDNWKEYKCKPYVMPFASSFNPDVDNSTNFRECMYQTDRSFFDMFSTPLLNNFDLLSKNIKITAGSLNQTRGVFSFVSDRLFTIADNLKSRFTNLDEQLRLFVIKLNDMFKKMSGVVRTTQYLFVALTNALQWLFDIPGQIAKAAIAILVGLMTVITFFLPFLTFIVVGLAQMVGMQASQCFSKNTLIKMKNNNVKKISQIKIGDELKTTEHDKNHTRCIITSIMKFKKSTEQMYNYYGIIVSGNHLIYHNNTWKRIKDCIDVVQKHRCDEPFIYNIVTTNNKIIVCDNTFHNVEYIFSDNNEISDTYTNALLNAFIIQCTNANKIIDISTINMTNINIEQEAQETGFHKHTLFNDIPIDRLNIGEYINNDTYITGITKHMAKDIILYDYKNIILSGSTPVYENNKVIRVYQSEHAKIINTSNEFIYNITTNTGKIPLSELIFLDFNEINDKKIDNFITDITINVKNKLFDKKYQ
jgi:hypothetical protein